jgi:hypothetical protein
MLKTIITLQKNRTHQFITEKRGIYYPRSEYHCRYPALFLMNDSSRWSTYHRSHFKRIEGEKTNAFTFLGNQKNAIAGIYPKTGCFYNPLRFKNYQKAIQPIEKTDIIQSSPASWYDRLLNQQKNMAFYIVHQIKQSDAHFLINADNHYPCILFTLPKPPAEKNPKTWSQFLLVYFIAFTNKLALERGINIEIVRRSSFGSLRPSVADCGESVRVNLGLIPHAYADCIIEAMLHLKTLFDEPAIFQRQFKPDALKETLQQYNETKSTPEKNIDIHLKETLWDTLWAAGDSSNRSFASQFFRKAYVVEYLIDLILEASLKDSLENLIEQKDPDVFVRPLETILSKICLDKARLCINIHTDSLKQYTWNKAHQIKEDTFWDLAKDFGQRLGLSLEDPVFKRLIKEQKTEDFHNCFEAWLANFAFQPAKDETVEDGYGSDSDEEVDIDIDDEMLTIYAKKFITATGMRAIQLSYAAARMYLCDNYGIDLLNITVDTTNMYYETNEALLDKYAIPLDDTGKRKKKTLKSNLGFFDLNHCNATQNREKMNVFSTVEAQDRICVLDITSSTTEEVHHALRSLWLNRPNLEIILTLSSGLKNEQNMSDYNPYGTVRIFAKDPEAMNKIYHDLISLEESADYKHPKESHLLRRTAKITGMTLTNKAILTAGIEP